MLTEVPKTLGRKHTSPEKQRRRRTFAYLWLLLGMMTLLVTASFAWFSISPTPRVSDMAVFVSAPAGLQLSTTLETPDELWGQTIYFPELISEGTPLKPVTWSDRDQCFKSVRYGTDGRQTSQWKVLSDAKNANQIGNDQYYVYASFYAKTDTACGVSLADAVERNGGLYGSGTYVIGEPLWNEFTQSHENMGKGAQLAVRIGLRITPVNPNTGAALGDSEFFVYEPNADTHLDQSLQFLDTSSIDGTDTLVARDHLIQQSTSVWKEADPPQKDVTVKQLGEFTNNVELFAIQPGEYTRIDLYIWMEGQDLDCFGLPDTAHLLANIQFNTDYTAQSGLEEID